MRRLLQHDSNFLQLFAGAVVLGVLFVLDHLLEPFNPAGLGVRNTILALCVLCNGITFVDKLKDCHF